MHNLLKVTKVSEIKQNEDGLRYVSVSFRPFLILSSGIEVYSNQKEKTRTLFAAHGEFKADPLFDDIQAKLVKSDSMVEGTVVTFNTTEYQPEGFKDPVYTASYAIFKGENAEKYANRQLKQYYACTVDENGTPTNYEQLAKPTGIAIKGVTTTND